MHVLVLSRCTAQISNGIDIHAIHSRVSQSAGLMSKARRFVKSKFVKRNRREADSSHSSHSHAVKDIYSQFGEVKPELLLRFGADDDKSAFTMNVWDFGGQRVSCVM